MFSFSGESSANGARGGENNIRQKMIRVIVRLMIHIMKYRAVVVKWPEIFITPFSYRRVSTHWHNTKTTIPPTMVTIRFLLNQPTRAVMTVPTR